MSTRTTTKQITIMCKRCGKVTMDQPADLRTKKVLTQHHEILCDLFNKKKEENKMSTFDVTVTLTIQAKDGEVAMARVGDILTGMRRHKIEDVHFEQVELVKE